MLFWTNETPVSLCTWKCVIIFYETLQCETSDYYRITDFNKQAWRILKIIIICSDKFKKKLCNLKNKRVRKVKIIGLINHTYCSKLEFEKNYKKNLLKYSQRTGTVEKLWFNEQKTAELFIVTVFLTSMTNREWKNICHIFVDWISQENDIWLVRLQKITHFFKI